ncbi:MAG: hypothetical protein ABS41_02720 [Arenimonas sp. SCN 70-307]|uniref:hypothetical protein n=1 Tax=Arenimonas sp. SCN 70-307 TaxID=1660089 RepID=UPI00086ECEC9|nr:hypothetical protein [Arenimonas sp. SCN 70-307]ODS64364.1 MAG: hypothetical protein ABS41_02720 [Arenimonas sp. SCN 70-307]
MLKWLRKSFVWLLALLVGYVLLVQVLRWIAFGEEERAALALMEPLPPPPAGEGGFKYLAFPDLDIPADELDAALARDLAAFGEWHAGAADRMTMRGESKEVWESPLKADYPARAALNLPKGACDINEPDCLAVMRGNEPVVREWLQAETVRLDLAERALASDHLANPYPLAIDSPLAGFQMLRLPLNAIALQALDGDLPGALDRACGLLAAERRFFAQDGMLIDKMVHGALIEGAAGLVLGLRRADPAAPMPASCAQALAPVVQEHYLACGAFKHEYGMVASVSRQVDGGGREGWHPRQAVMRWTLTSERLMRGWSATHFAPLCSDEGKAAILAGDVPVASFVPSDFASVDFWAAPFSRTLADIAAPTYDRYQDRLLDHAASLRLHLAAIAAVGGELPIDAVPENAASPGYTLTVEDGHWVLPLRLAPNNTSNPIRIALPE